MKKLLASGCSWTDTNYISSLEFLPDEKRSGWPMWPELVGKELGLDVINTAWQGRGNEYIGQSIIDNIIKYGDEVELVSVLWTQVDRFDIYNSTSIPILQVLAEKQNNQTLVDILAREVNHLTTNPFSWDMHEWRRHDVFNTWNNTTLRAMYTIAEMCAHRNIKCVFDQGIIFFWHRELAEIESIIHADMFITEVDYMAMLETNVLYQRLMRDYSHLFIKPKAILDYKHTIGYLIHHRDDLKIHMPEHLLSGDVVEDYNDLDKIDAHPNPEGQKLISERYMECLKKYY